MWAQEERREERGSSMAGTHRGKQSSAQTDDHVLRALCGCMATWLRIKGESKEAGGLGKGEKERGGCASLS